MSKENPPMSRMAERAQSVLDNSAFQESMAELRDDAIQAILTAKPDLLLMARMRYDALENIGSELERRLHTKANSRE